MSSLFPASFEVNSLESIYCLICYIVKQIPLFSVSMLFVSKTFSLSPISILTTHEASLPWSQVSFLITWYILVLMYIDATLQPTRLLTYLLKRLHLHFLRSMHSQDVTRWILPLTSRNNRSCFRLHVLLCDRKSSSLPSTDEAKSSFFDPTCVT